MKIKQLVCAFFIVVLSFTNIFADSPMNKYLSKIAILEGKDGRKIETYEDVVINLDPFQEKNKEYPIVNREQIPEGYVNKETAQSYFNRFSDHAVIVEEDTDYKDFFNEYFYLFKEVNSEDNKDKDDDEENLLDGDSGVSVRLQNFPIEYLEKNPGTNTYNLCMEGGYEYVKKFKAFKPNALSCKSCEYLCGEKCSNGHILGAKNVFSDFKSKLLNNTEIEEAEEVNDPDNYIQIICKDRTPPKFDFEVKGKRVADGEEYSYAENEDKKNIGIINNEKKKRQDELDDEYERTKEPDYATTGDWFHTREVGVTDNFSDEIYAKYAFGRINECPIDGQRWEDYEKWDFPENIIKVTKNTFLKLSGDFYRKKSFSDIVRFGIFDGVIRYSIYAKEGDPEGKGNLNPSCFDIKENMPECCYGLNENIDLGNTPSTAKEWPDKRALGDVNEMGRNARVIRVADNDKPNIIIRVTDTESGEQIFFPPCVASSVAKISNSSLYRSLRSKTNYEEYCSFVENLSNDYDYNIIAENPIFKPYYTIYSIDDKDIKTENVDSYVKRMLLNNDLEFINQNVRVEDYYYSDINADGSRGLLNKPRKIGEVGKRNGTFSKMVVLLENNNNSFRFKTGVEYKLDVWVDDNVKWTNVRRKKSVGDYDVMQEAKVYHTGIELGEIRLDIPHIDKSETEDNSESLTIDNTNNINGGILFKLDESTPFVYDFKTCKEIEKNKFPSITVKVEDFAGLARELKVFFRVNDKNVDIRTLEK